MFHNTFDSAFKIQRTDENPYIAGDVFILGDDHITLIETDPHKVVGHWFGFHSLNGVIRIKAFKGVGEILEMGYNPVPEYIEKSQELAINELYAPRKLKDGTWCALSPLAYTTAIHIDFDDLTPFETRYCFGDSRYFPRHLTALYWLCRLESKYSLPVGNCAYRGILGCEPIVDADLTHEYYRDMQDLKYMVQTKNGLDMHGLADKVMSSIILEMVRC